MWMAPRQQEMLYPYSMGFLHGVTDLNLDQDQQVRNHGIKSG